MNQAVRDYVASVIERHPEKVRGARVLEIGSYNVNGTVRDLFEAAGCASYLGVDIRPGPGVDLVVNRQTYQIPGDFDVVVCCEVLEHEAEPRRLCELATRGLHDGGLFILTTRGIGYGMHDEPADFYRFTPHGLEYVMEFNDLTAAEIIDHKESMGVFGYAIA